MTIYQKQILQLSIVCLGLLVFFSFFKEKRAAKWVMWYYQMDKKEQKRYNPMITIKRTRIILLLASLIGLVGFALSFYYRYSETIAFTIILIVFSVGIIFLGPKGCKKNNKKDI